MIWNFFRIGHWKGEWDGAHDAPPNSLKDSNVSLKVKTIEKGVGVRSLVHSISKVRGACWSFKIGTRTSEK